MPPIDTQSFQAILHLRFKLLVANLMFFYHLSSMYKKMNYSTFHFDILNISLFHFGKIPDKKIWKKTNVTIKLYCLQNHVFLHTLVLRTSYAPLPALTNVKGQLGGENVVCCVVSFHVILKNTFHKTLRILANVTIMLYCLQNHVSLHPLYWEPHALPLPSLTTVKDQ